MAKDRPWMKFECLTWLSDPHLSCCSPTDRGVLIDLMSLAHFGEPYGYISNGGQPLGDLEIQRTRHYPYQLWRKSRDNLLKANRIAQDEDTGAYYIPRMVEDAKKSALNSVHGMWGGNQKLGGGGNRPQPKAEPSACVMFKEYADTIWLCETRKQPEKVAKLYAKVQKVLGKEQHDEMKELIEGWKKDPKSKNTRKQ